MVPPPTNPKKLDVDAAKDAKLLLDLVAITKDAAVVLDNFQHKRASALNKTDSSELDVIVQALCLVHEEGRKQAARVSSVSRLLAGYDMRVSADKEKNESRRRGSVQEESMLEIKQFVGICKKNLLRSNSMEATPTRKIEEPESRRSERIPLVTPEKSMEDEVNEL